MTSDAATDWSIYRRLLGYVKPHWGWFAIAVTGFLIGSGAEAYFAQLLGQIIDAFDAPSARQAWIFPVMMLAAAFARGVGAITGEFLLSRISFQVVHKIRCQLFERLLVLPSAFFDKSSQGHLVSRLTYTTAQLRDTATDALKIIVQDGGKVIVVLTVMFYGNWLLTLIFLAVTPVVGAVVSYASRRFRRISGRIQQSMGDVTHVASEAVSGHRVMRTFGGEEYERERFFGASERNRRQNLKMVATKATSTQLIQMFVAIALALLVSLLLQPEIAGTMTKGELVAYLGLAALLANPIKKLSAVNARLQRGLAAAEDIFSQLDQDAEADSGELSVERVAGAIEFRNVSFRYETSPQLVIKDVSFVIEPGQTVALVGRSGSGKSTLASLLPRFYEPERGEVFLDGKPLRSYRLSSLRSQIALVTQEVTLFNDTLGNNIAYGSLQASTPEAVNDAITRAHADEFIRQLPDRLDTLVGDNGVLLSGGQRQRVAIARALLKDAPILILDEATSALDVESESHIQDALREVMKGRTTLVIAHRLSTVENADVIMVVDEGRIVETGTHAELVAAGGAYAHLYKSQFRSPENVDGTHPDTDLPRRGAGATSLVGVERVLNPLVEEWYGRAFWPRLLLPFASLFAFFARRRRLQYITGKKSSWRAPVPVIIVGNISVGGTGKSPLVIWLAKWFQRRGLKVGIVSRGYGGKTKYPLLVTADTPIAEAGDEAPMLARRTECPVVVDPDRVRAVKHVLQAADCDLVLADDGLQHYALARDVEIVVLDGLRGVGNGYCLPAGPLREPVTRLQEVDWVVSNGCASGLAEESIMVARGVAFTQLGSGRRLAAEQFAANVDGPLYAFAGIGNPNRFHQTLIDLGLSPILKAFPDHHAFSETDLEVPANAWVVVTEKDAGKIRGLDSVPANCWYLEIDMAFVAEDVDARLVGLCKQHGIVLP